MLRWGIAIAGTFLLLNGWAGALRAQNPSVAVGQRSDLFQNTQSQLLKDLDQTLSLTDEQKRRIIAIKKEFERENKAALKKLRQEVQAVRQTMQAARKNNDTVALKKARGEAKTLQQAGERLHAEFEKELLALLSDEQKKQYAAFKKTPPATNLRPKAASASPLTKP
jgi:Spy/CpxP family protein refolding chaperone